MAHALMLIMVVEDNIEFPSNKNHINIRINLLTSSLLLYVTLRRSGHFFNVFSHVSHRYDNFSGYLLHTVKSQYVTIYDCS